MALMTFGQSYSVGVQSIDSQHKVLFEIVNELYAAMMKGQAKNLTGPLLHKLAEYTKTHFCAEEAIMAIAKYPGLAAHKLQHRDLVKQVEEYLIRFEKSETLLNVQLLRFLRDWLTSHIQKVDKEYGPWLNAHGVC